MAKKKQKQKQSIFGKIRVFKAPIEVGRAGVTLVLPKTVLKYINADEGTAELFWSPVNGVVQISGEQPHMIIPMMSVNEDEFLPQDGDAPVVLNED